MSSNISASILDKLKHEVELKKDSLYKSQKELIENPESLNISQLLGHCEDSDSNLRMLAFGLMLDKLLKEIPNPADLRIYHKKALKFSKLFPGYKNYIEEQYMLYLANIIDACTTSEDLVKLIKFITQIEGFIGISSIKQLFYSKFICCVMNECDELQSQMNIKNLKKLLYQLKMELILG